MKTKEQIAKYNKEYFARPEVIARAKERNKKYRERRRLYKKTEKGRKAENKYRNKVYNSKGKYKRMELRYGLGREDYELLLVEQNNVCAICKTPKEGTLHIDHGHETGEVRGLLCSNCNMGIGLFKDDRSNLIEAINYLDYAVQKNNSSRKNTKTKEKDKNNTRGK